ncbi:MAG: hypothetical protein P1U32_04980 [Legionellaceae bacterium]|nr:hypothetical protein [Legionellaceae bacterium]
MDTKIECDTQALDERRNPVSVTLFESYLAKFILEHPAHYQGAYLKLFDALKPACALQDRIQHAVFSLLQAQHPEYTSFDDFHPEHFSLSAADYLLKLLADHMFTPSKSPSPPNFFTATDMTTRSPTNLCRNKKLFSDANRGVIGVEPISSPPHLTHTIGIVSKAYQPPDLTDYFAAAIEPSGQYYEPAETSHVAIWLRERNLPVIAGASGSTEALIARILPYAPVLSAEEKRLITFTQACNMVANGHHSLFEALIVADDLELILVQEADTQKALYLQCVPASLLEDEAFIAFMGSELVQNLLPNTSVTKQPESP